VQCIVHVEGRRRRTRTRGGGSSLFAIGIGTEHCNGVVHYCLLWDQWRIEAVMAWLWGQWGSDRTGGSAA
jgi:hypothetical protein